jgi:hypothetical protein
VIYLLKEQREILKKAINDACPFGPHDPRKEKLDFLDNELRFWDDLKNF